VDNERVAAIKVRSERPSSLPFYHWQAGFPVDLLLDFPLSAAELASRAPMNYRDFLEDPPAGFEFCTCLAKIRGASAGQCPPGLRPPDLRKGCCIDRFLTR